MRCALVKTELPAYQHQWDSHMQLVLALISRLVSRSGVTFKLHKTGVCGLGP